MNDLKNLTLAWVSSTSSVFAAVEAKTWMTVTSAIILPIVFFALGKTVDVVVQVYLKNRYEARGDRDEGPGMSRKVPERDKFISVGRSEEQAEPYERIDTSSTP